MATDIDQRIAEALVGVLTAAAGVTAITGETERSVVETFAEAAAATRPVVAFTLVVTTQPGGLGNHYRAQVKLACFAADGTARVARELRGAAVAALTATAFLNLTSPHAPLDAAVVSVSRRTGPRETGRARADADVTLDVHA